MFMLLFVACEQTIENEDTIISESSNIPGDWTVNAYIDNNKIFGPFTISAQMTLENESITLKDNGEFWKFQTKAELIDSKDTFETKSSINELSNVESKINILNGIVINNDSIVFDIQFEDDETPYGVTYKLMGRRK